MPSAETGPVARPRRRAPRDTNINFRVSAETRDLIDMAAAAIGKTRTEFVLDSAKQRALDVLLEQRVFVLNDTEYEALMRVLDAPPPANAALGALMSEGSPWEE